MAQTTFTDVTVSAGVDYTHHAPNTPPSCLFGGFFCQPERMSGGAAVADVDGDGDLDLFVTRFDAHDLLFLNDGDGTFSDGTAASGLSAYDLHSNGAGFADIDNDGDPDLLVTVLGEYQPSPNPRNYLFINDGSGVFTEDALVRGAAVPTVFLQDRMTFSVAFGDYDADGFVDLHVTEWQNGEHSKLLRNLGGASPGYFEDRTAAAGLDFIGVNGFASSFVDLDGDGWQDLAVAADFETSKLYWNDGDGTFTDGTVAAGVGTDENGMGSAFGDYDGDGDLDWFVTAIDDPNDPCGLIGCNWGASGNRLYRNDGGRSFSDQTDAAGVRNGYFGWGAAFFDYDNDGDLDLAMTNGVNFPIEILDDDFHADPMRMWENDGTGAMTEVSTPAGLTDTGSGKGLLVFDYDQDGDQDLFVVNNAGSPVLYRNDYAGANDWLRVRVIGTTSNRDGLGAKVEVLATPTADPQVREVGVKSHFLGQSEREVHFGLGAGVPVVHRVTVNFPSGIEITLDGVASGQTLDIIEPLPAPGLGWLGRVVLVGLFGVIALWRGSAARR